MPPERLVESIRAVTADVFEKMLNLEIAPAEAVAEPDASNVTDGVVALIGLAGDWVGTGVLQCDAGLACTLYSHLLMTDATDGVTADVLDAVAEIANMIVGAVKNDIECELGAMGMSVPTVVFGRHFTTRSTGTPPWTAATFRCAGSYLHVRISLAPRNGPRLSWSSFSLGQLTAE